MSKITLSQLENFLLSAADVLRSKMDASKYKVYILGLLFLKRMNDNFFQKQKQLRVQYEKEKLPADLIAEMLEDKTSYGSTFFVPIKARWVTSDTGDGFTGILNVKDRIGTALNAALVDLSKQNLALNGVFDNIDFNEKVKGKPILTDAMLSTLITKFNKVRLTNDNFVVPDLLGAAYEYMIKNFADSAGKKGGEFYTPSQVVRLMVRLIKPRAGMTVYDPTVGSGGMLIQSRQYVEELGEDPDNLAVYGQENTSDVWQICKMNMILHEVKSNFIEYGDTIIEPHIWETKHKNIDGLPQFDRVIANPPFSQNYKRDEKMQQQGRFCYGWAPETGKKADLMFVEHMIASTHESGMMITVMPHGVLFRGGKEKAIRQAILKADLIEAIIGLPPDLFYGTGIPACLIIINKHNTNAIKNRILIINADAEYGEGKNQNYLRPEDVEKIVNVYETKSEVPGYSRIVSLDEIMDKDTNDCNLNIRRYVDNSPDQEPQNVKAHLAGGIPKTEVESLNGRLAKYEIKDRDLFTDDGSEFYHFKKECSNKDGIKSAILNCKGVQNADKKIHQAFEEFWEQAAQAIAVLHDRSSITAFKKEYTGRLKKTLTPIGILDRFQNIGVFANWWDHSYTVRESVIFEEDSEGNTTSYTVKEIIDIKNVFKTIKAQGFVESLVSDEKIANEHCPDLLQEIADLQADIENAHAELQDYISQIEIEREEPEDGEEEKEITVSEVKKYLNKCKRETSDREEKAGYTKQLNEIKALENGIKELNKKYKDKNAELQDKIQSLRETMTAAQCETLVMQLLHEGFIIELDKYLKAEVDKTIKAIQHLWDKYFVSVSQLLAEREQAEDTLNGFLKALYENPGVHEMSKWIIATLADHFSLRARIGWQGLRSDEFTSEGPTLITGTDFHDGTILWDKCYHVEEWRYFQDPGIQIKDNDLLITKDGTIGKIAFVKSCPPQTTLNSGVFVVRETTKKASTRYLFYILASETFERFKRNILTGSTIKHLNQATFYKMKFDMPQNTAEQSKIAEVLTAMYTVIEKTKAINAKYQKIKEGMLQDLLTNKISVEPLLKKGGHA